MDELITLERNLKIIMISEFEYKMVREEIFFYQNKNQEVRNMMYAITIAYLGLLYSNENEHSFLYLVPLAIIIPSYMISYDYLVCICRAATYLMVFGEKGENSISHWERKYIYSNRYSINMFLHFTDNLFCL